MKIAAICLIFFSIHTVCALSLINVQFHVQKMSRSICKIINDITSTNSDTHDVLVGNLGGEIVQSSVLKVVECVSDENAVIVVDLGVKIKRKRLWKAAVIVLDLIHSDEVGAM